MLELAVGSDDVARLRGRLLQRLTSTSARCAFLGGVCKTRGPHRWQLGAERRPVLPAGNVELEDGWSIMLEMWSSSWQSSFDFKVKFWDISTDSNQSSKFGNDQTDGCSLGCMVLGVGGCVVLWCRANGRTQLAYLKIFIEQICWRCSILMLVYFLIVTSISKLHTMGCVRCRIKLVRMQHRTFGIGGAASLQSPVRCKCLTLVDTQQSMKILVIWISRRIADAYW